MEEQIGIKGLRQNENYIVPYYWAGFILLDELNK